MLLLIAVANVPWFLYGGATADSNNHPAEGSTLDRIAQAITITAIDARIYPLFAFLFGYGIVMLYSRQRRAGADDRSARSVLRRRHLWMLLFGAIHAALLWYGDVIGAWALAGLVLVALFLRRKDKTLIVWAVVFTAVLTLVTILSLVASMYAPTGQEVDSEWANFNPNSEPNYLMSIVWRMAFWPVVAIGQGLIMLAPPVMILLAFWAARRQILENPGEHLPLLRKVAWVGIPIGWIFGAVHALVHIGVLEVDPRILPSLMLVQAVSGIFGAAGYVALFTLISHRIQQRGSGGAAPVRFMTSIGKRSLSSYVAQSVIFAPLLAAWGLGLGESIGSATAALIAIGAWLLIGVGAYIADTKNYRGPLESILRRLVYRKSAS